jgi:uncharacterized membrane protein
MKPTPPKIIYDTGVDVISVMKPIRESALSLVSGSMARSITNRFAWTLTSLMMMVMMGGVAAAAPGGGGGGGGGGAAGICGMPGGQSLVPLLMNFVAGVLVLGGVLMFGYGMVSVTTDQRRGTSGRKVALLGIGAIVVGLVFGQIPGWLAGVMGTSLSSLGLGCL